MYLCSVLLIDFSSLLTLYYILFKIKRDHGKNLILRNKLVTLNIILFKMQNN